MMFYVVVLVSAFSLAFAQNCTEAVNSVGESNLSCDYWQTQCSSGCCNFQDATCCTDGIFCCPHGYSCINIIGLCVKWTTEAGEKAHVFLEKAATVKKATEAAKTLTDMTPCFDSYCPMVNAVCCPDRLHCCPQDHMCTASGCIKVSEENTL